MKDMKAFLCVGTGWLKALVADDEAKKALTRHPAVQIPLRGLSRGHCNSTEASSPCGKGRWLMWWA